MNASLRVISSLLLLPVDPTSALSACLLSGVCHVKGILLMLLFVLLLLHQPRAKYSGYVWCPGLAVPVWSRPPPPQPLAPILLWLSGPPAPAPLTLPASVSLLSRVPVHDSENIPVITMSITIHNQPKLITDQRFMKTSTMRPLIFLKIVQRNNELCPLMQHFHNFNYFQNFLLCLRGERSSDC